MTFEASLRFSVLSAPVASADRRALSSAWYSALYHTRQHTTSSPQICTEQRARRTERRPENAGLAQRPQTAAPLRVLAGGIGSRTGKPLCPIERRSAVMPLVKRMHTAISSSGLRTRHATVRIAGTRERVLLLIAAQGRSMRIIAICSKPVERLVAGALSDLRYRCAVQGLAVTSNVKTPATC